MRQGGVEASLPCIVKDRVCVSALRAADFLTFADERPRLRGIEGSDNDEVIRGVISQAWMEYLSYLLVLNGS